MIPGGAGWCQSPYGRYGVIRETESLVQVNAYMNYAMTFYFLESYKGQSGVPCFGRAKWLVRPIRHQRAGPSVSVTQAYLDEPQSDRPEPLTVNVFGPTHFPCSLTPNSEVYHNSLSLLSNFLYQSMCSLCAVAQKTLFSTPFKHGKSL